MSTERSETPCMCPTEPSSGTPSALSVFNTSGATVSCFGYFPRRNSCAQKRETGCVSPGVRLRARARSLWCHTFAKTTGDSPKRPATWARANNCNRETVSGGGEARPAANGTSQKDQW